MKHRTGWQSLVEWAVGLGLLALAVVGALSIGVFVMPFALAALLFAALRNRAWPEAVLGGLLGVGSVFLFVAYRNRLYSPCPPGPMRLAHGQHFSCGGFDPMPWLTIGLVLIVGGVSGYLLSRGKRTTAAAI
ncbi:MAG TPA: hypothetical protein VGJ62_15200 [Gemmatimonadaceae bacterium]|jgi:hypothetical protein